MPVSLEALYERCGTSVRVTPVFGVLPRGTSLTRNSPLLGPYRRPVPRGPYVGPRGGGGVLMGEVPLYDEHVRPRSNSRTPSSPLTFNPTPCPTRTPTPTRNGRGTSNGSNAKSNRGTVRAALLPGFDRGTSVVRKRHPPLDPPTTRYP